MTVVVLAADWHSGVDPVPYYSTDPDGCLDFSSRPLIPRARLQARAAAQMVDCEHGVRYDVVICESLS